MNRHQDMENKKRRYIELYSDIATRISEMSHAQRLKVGCVVVKDNNIISFGWNGMPSGWDNNCEDRVYPNKLAGDFDQHYDEFDLQFPLIDDGIRYRLKTKPQVMHSERNALDKLARQSNSGGIGADIFITHAPCLECAKSILGAGINTVYYRQAYRETTGIEFLTDSGVKVEQYTDPE